MRVPLAIRLASTFLVLATVAQECGAQTDTTNTMLDSGVATWLGHLADTATVEHMACLVGGWRHDTLVIDYAYEPLPYVKQTQLAVATNRGCSMAAVGIWHIHLPIAVRIRSDGKPQTDPIPPRAACYYSKGDTYGLETRYAAKLDPNLVMEMVQVSSTIACWWLDKQILEYTNGEILDVPPIRGQATFQ